jgi:hypothetical protein
MPFLFVDSDNIVHAKKHAYVMTMSAATPRAFLSLALETAAWTRRLMHRLNFVCDGSEELDSVSDDFEEVELSEEQETYLLGQVEYHLLRCRQHYSHRVAITCDSVANFLSQLEKVQQRDITVIRTILSTSLNASELCLLFPGQIKFAPGMGPKYCVNVKSLCTSHSVFCSSVMDCLRILGTLLSLFFLP